MTLPPQIRALMRNTIKWERFTGRDGHGDPTYAAPVTLKCWLEVRMGQGDVQRRQSVGRTTMDPEIDLFLDGDDADALSVTTADRLTYTLNGQSFQTQPDSLSAEYGPDSSVWLVRVAL